MNSWTNLSETLQEKLLKSIKDTVLKKVRCLFLRDSAALFIHKKIANGRKNIARDSVKRPSSGVDGWIR